MTIPKSRGRRDAAMTPRLVQPDVPVWVLQGGRNSVVCPERVLETITALGATGHPDVRLAVHEDLGHRDWTGVHEGCELYHRFLAHRR